MRAGKKDAAFTALTHTHTHTIREVRKEQHLMLNTPNILHDMEVKLLKKIFFSRKYKEKYKTHKGQGKKGDQ